jgi:hypothetical protein
MHSVIVSVAVLSILVGPLRARAAQSPDRLIGLLALPQLFGNGACDRFEAHPLALYADDDGTVAIGEVRIDRPWTFPQDGGCEGLQIGVHLFGAGQAARDLPTREYDYEEPGALVLARRGGRFRITLPDGAAWIEPLAGAEFHPMETLVAENLSYLTDAWGGMVCAEPGQSGTCRKIDAGGGPEPGVTVLGHREIAGRLWFQIELPSSETCGEPVPAIPHTSGWISGHDNNGAPTIWFYSRGC